jgi:hypothetical protein
MHSNYPENYKPSDERFNRIIRNVEIRRGKKRLRIILIHIFFIGGVVLMHYYLK